MLTRVDRIASETLGAINRHPISDAVEVRAILEHAAALKSALREGASHVADSRAATIVRLSPRSMLLHGHRLDQRGGSHFFFNFAQGDVHYFFACSAISAGGREELYVTIPEAIYRAERRDASRRLQGGRVVVLESDALGGATAVQGINESRDGIGIRVPGAVAGRLPDELRIRIGESGESCFGRIRHRTADSQAGWVKIGLSVSAVSSRDLIRVDRRERILGRDSGAREKARLVRAGFSALAQRIGIFPKITHDVKVIRYTNDRAQTICAIENSWGGESRGETAVIIPPAWGRTKETLLPLALTLVETFRKAGEAIRVIRFDGTNRRGESYIDPACRRPGAEYRRFTFSQAARDISATVDYLKRGEARAPNRIVLVTFSLAAVEARHALARDDRISGWVSVVGMADLNSALKTISGGIDFGNGLSEGVRFGEHELAGVIADMDHTGLDAIQNGFGFLEDARRDMAQIEIPVTWIHGRHDAWMDLDRVVEVMSCGRTDNRRLIEVPTGHQLRSGQKALETFQLVAEAVTEMALDKRRRGVIPRLSRIVAARSAELARIPEVHADIRQFWADYLLGRSRVLGMELLTATPSYRDFMKAQVERLQLGAGQRIGDLGSGNGEFAISLESRGAPDGVVVIEFDLVRDALIHARGRRGASTDALSAAPGQCVTDLDLKAGLSIPVASGSFDAVLSSLLISYVSDHRELLREIYRVLKPGGRTVISSMIKDADGMMLFHDGVIEYATTEARSFIGSAVDAVFNSLVRDFLNDGSRLLDLEERGLFRFWEAEELRYEVASAGFIEVEVEHGFGNPPQAVIVSARRR